MELLNQYRALVGDKKIDEIINESEPLRNKQITHINSTYYGGGVAEVLDGLVPLMNDVGIKAGWRLLKGSEPFFNITKLFHNGAQGGEVELDEDTKRVYEEMCEHNSKFMHFDASQVIVAHDPQVLPLIKYYDKDKPWIWRCHIDITSPNKRLWNYLKSFIEQYDEMVVSDPEYFKNNIDISQSVIMPSINPLNDKNKELSKKERRKYLQEAGIKIDKPIISQISRYDRWKDPLGVIEVFKRVKKETDCRLVLLGNSATDDPEGEDTYKRVLKQAQDMKDVEILLNVEKNDLVVNALQAESRVVLQKSLREGFALTVSEALWKGVPVVAGNVGGIPNQIKEGRNGFLVKNIEECADKVTELLKNEKKRKEMGEYGREYVRENFLITRHLLDYIKLLKKYI
ncbi:MAG: glycosyltransferase [Patescibacteria group bacterium]